MRTEKEKVKFSIEQQACFDRALDEAFGRGVAKGARQSQAEIDKLKHEIERLKTPWWRR